MIKSKLRSLVAVLVTGVLAAIPSVGSASSLESEIELLRTDLKAAKVDIVKEVVHVEGAKADAFWPVYRKYQAELDAINDKRIVLIKDYAANFTNMSDEKAKSLVKQALDLQSQRNALLKKHYANFEKVLGAIDAARLVQVEHLVMALVDVQLGAEMPLVEKPTAKSE